jgi:hypothetical protein
MCFAETENGKSDKKRMKNLKQRACHCLNLHYEKD